MPHSARDQRLIDTIIMGPKRAKRTKATAVVGYDFFFFTFRLKLCSGTDVDTHENGDFEQRVDGVEDQVCFCQCDFWN